jgi:hypothetical protein
VFITAHVTRYPGLPPGAKYSVSVTGLDEKSKVGVRANNDVIFNGTVTSVGPDGVWTVGVPTAATRSGGDLLLSFAGQDGAMLSEEKSGTTYYAKGNGIKLAEVWLRKIA